MSFSLESCDDASVFHSFEFNKIIEEVLGREVNLVANDDSFYITHPDRKLGFLKINYCPDPRLECVYGGILGKINNKFKGLWHITTTPGANIDKYIKKGFCIKERSTSILDLSKTTKELWDNLDKKTRNLVRKGEKNEIKIVQTTNIGDYYKILEETYKKANLKILPIEFYKEILNRLGKVFLAYYDNEIVAGGGFLKFKDRVYYWNGAAHKDYLYLAPNNLIQWEFIKWARENEFKKYDLLGLDIPSIAKFKEGFGGVKVKFYTLLNKSLYHLKRFKDFLRP